MSRADLRVRRGGRRRELATKERVDALVATSVDVLLIDSSHGHSEGVLQRIRKRARNILTCRSSAATSPLAPERARAGGSRLQRGEVGIGPGSHLYYQHRHRRGVVRRSLLFPTRWKRWKGPVFRLSLTAVSVSPAISPSDRRRCAAVMVSSMLAGTEESPGEMKTLSRSLLQIPYPRDGLPWRDVQSSSIAISRAITP